MNQRIIYPTDDGGVAVNGTDTFDAGTVNILYEG
jgi:hypothetical protein